MAPIYEKVYNIEPSELRDERFLSRLRRSGLGESLPKEKEINKETKQRRNVVETQGFLLKRVIDTISEV